MNSRRWGNLIVSLIVVGMMPLTASTNAGRVDRPWPMLLSSTEPGDLRIAMLQYRANAALERLVQSAPTAE